MDGESKLIKNIIVPALACVFISLVLETTLFNFRHWQSRGYEQIVCSDITTSANLEMRDAGVYEVMSLDAPVYIDVNLGGLTQINNVYVDIWPKAEPFNVDRLRMHFWVNDEGNPTGYDMPKIDYVRSVMQTMYTAVDPSGRCSSFRIVIDEGLSAGELIRIENISFNIPIPLGVSKKRILALACILMILYFLRPSSQIYSVRAADKFKGKLAVILLALLGQALLMWNICNLNGACKNPIYDSEHQFEMMAEALAQDKTYLLIDPPQALTEMDNPYSYQKRLELGVSEETMYDVAYYDGHYYVYFGIGPILIFYLPVYLLTGSFIPTYIIMFIIGVLTAGGWMLLLYELIKKYFPDFSFASYIVCSMLFSAGCGLTYVMSRPSFYAIPMTFALTCSLYGLAFWFKAIKDDGNVVNALNSGWMFAGSLCMAFVAACRPQFLIGSFLAIIIFWGAVFKERKLFSKAGIPATVCFILPYVIVAAGVMYYNAVRFGSVFDFGANYNLTFNDMTYRGFKLDRLLYGTAGFLFMPAKVINKFPYFTPGAYSSQYMGYISDEQLLGGLFYNHLYLLSIVSIPKARKLIKDKALYIMALIMPVFALIVMIVDANMAGVLNRYFVDFSWLIILSFFILFGYIKTDEEIKPYQKIIDSAFYVLAIMSFVHMFFMVFGGDVNGLENNAITVFQKVAHMIEFWN